MRYAAQLAVNQQLGFLPSWKKRKTIYGDSEKGIPVQEIMCLNIRMRKRMLTKEQRMKMAAKKIKEDD